jgi:hypothetical protein
MAEADGNRTRLTEMLGHVGFEDRGGHQAPIRLPGDPGTVTHYHPGGVAVVEPGREGCPSRQVTRTTERPYGGGTGPKHTPENE